MESYYNTDLQLVFTWQIKQTTKLLLKNILYGVSYLKDTFGPGGVSQLGGA